jgi:hypothetical protein
MRIRSIACAAVAVASLGAFAPADAAVSTKIANAKIDIPLSYHPEWDLYAQNGCPGTPRIQDGYGAVILDIRGRVGQTIDVRIDGANPGPSGTGEITMFSGCGASSVTAFAAAEPIYRFKVTDEQFIVVTTQLRAQLDTLVSFWRICNLAPCPV